MPLVSPHIFTTVYYPVGKFIRLSLKDLKPPCPSNKTKPWEEKKWNLSFRLLSSVNALLPYQVGNSPWSDISSPFSSFTGVVSLTVSLCHKHFTCLYCVFLHSICSEKTEVKITGEPRGDVSPRSDCAPSSDLEREGSTWRLRALSVGSPSQHRQEIVSRVHLVSFVRRRGLETRLEMRQQHKSIGSRGKMKAKAHRQCACACGGPRWPYLSGLLRLISTFRVLTDISW